MSIVHSLPKKLRFAHAGAGQGEIDFDGLIRVITKEPFRLTSRTYKQLRSAGPPTSTDATHSAPSKTRESLESPSLILPLNVLEIQSEPNGGLLFDKHHEDQPVPPEIAKAGNRRISRSPKAIKTYLMRTKTAHEQNLSTSNAKAHQQGTSKTHNDGSPSCIDEAEHLSSTPPPQDKSAADVRTNTANTGKVRAPGSTKETNLSRKTGNGTKKTQNKPRQRLEPSSISDDICVKDFKFPTIPTTPKSKCSTEWTPGSGFQGMSLEPQGRVPFTKQQPRRRAQSKAHPPESGLNLTKHTSPTENDVAPRSMNQPVPIGHPHVAENTYPQPQKATTSPPPPPPRPPIDSASSERNGADTQARQSPTATKPATAQSTRDPASAVPEIHHQQDRGENQTRSPSTTSNGPPSLELDNHTWAPSHPQHPNRIRENPPQQQQPHPKPISLPHQNPSNHIPNSLTSTPHTRIPAPRHSRKHILHPRQSTKKKCASQNRSCNPQRLSREA
ncbi:MAG: hypothetical protein Q9191_005973 [Dirinaria sp. TL-2023a]